MNKTREFVDAVGESKHYFERNGYGSERAIVYTNPNTLREVRKGANEWAGGFNELTLNTRVHGLNVETTDGFPEGMVAVAHLKAVEYGADAIRFHELEDE